jgi:osmotically-inducible protein OsmY
MKTDLQLQRDVNAELKWDPSINATRIGVEVNHGVVTLAGHVDSYADKWNAERCAQRVAGVQALEIEIDVRLADIAKRNDPDIATSAHSALQWTTFLAKDSVNVMVADGWVTLTGEVDWEYQRQLSADTVRFLSGVRGVSDQIMIRARVAAGAVKADIEAALKRRANADAQEISVEVSGGEVTLCGAVHSWSERELAKSSAWGAPGVRKVVDHMTLVH